MKKIVINAHAAIHGGGVTYLLNLIKNETRFKIILLVNSSNKKNFININNVDIVESKFAGKSLIHRSIWENFYLPYFLKKSKANLLFSVSGILPIFFIPKKCKTAVICQNMIPFCNEELRRFNSSVVKLKFHLIRISQIFSFKKANLVIFISNFAAKRVGHHFLKNKIKKSVIIPHGLPKIFVPREIEKLDRPLDYEYVTYVSSMFEYKAHLELIDAWSLLRRNRKTNEKLIFLGLCETRYGKKVLKKIIDNNMESEILTLGHIPYIELPKFYQNAKLNVFASSCENCPNILLESLASGAPTMCSNFPPMPEFGEDGVEYFNPYDVNETYVIMKKLLDNEKYRLVLSKKAVNISKKYQWEIARKKTFEEFEKIIEYK